ncbi:MAG: HTTM domain-containing protein [Polyangiaceae bacterium]
MTEDEESGPYWPSVLGPSRAVLPFVVGVGPFLAVVATLVLIHTGRSVGAANRFGLGTLIGSLLAGVVVSAVGGTLFALAHPTWGWPKKLLVTLLWRIPPLLSASIWYWVGFKHEWFGTFSRSMPRPDGAPGAFVTTSDLCAGALALPLGIAIYHRRWIWDRYCKIDPRTLGLFRIVLGSLCTIDVIRRWQEARLFYSSEGVLTNHFLLYRPFEPHNLSLWNAFSTPAEVHVIFAIAALCHVMFLVGYRTRLFNALSFVLIVSLDQRLVMIENGGYVILNLLVGYALFMPVGLRFSVDALLRSFREHKEKGWSDLANRYRPEDQSRPAEGAIYLLALANIAICYFFNVVNKSGDDWKAGKTVHYVLQIDRMLTPFGAWLRDLHLPFPFTRFVSWATLVIEALICAWILWPTGRRYTRPLAMAWMHVLHGMFAGVFRLGPFSYSMMTYSYLLPTRENWRDLERWCRRRASARTVVLDRTSPLAFFLGRLLARLDRLDLLTLEPSSPEHANPPLLVVKDAEGRRYERAKAVFEIARSLPGGTVWRYPLWALSLFSWDPIMGYLSGHRAEIARFFSLGLTSRDKPEQPSISPIGARLASIGVTARETLVAYLAVCAFFEMMVGNPCFPTQLKPPLPIYIKAVTGYTRWRQGWRMFAPNPLRDDGVLAIDAFTLDGRHIDPLTGREPDLFLSDAKGMGLPQVYGDYENRIRMEDYKTYRQGLRDYLLRYHEHTGRPEDELVSFDVYWLHDWCAEPGSWTPHHHEKIALLTYRKHGFTPPPGFPVLPLEPKLDRPDFSVPSDGADPNDPPHTPERRSSDDLGQ